MKLKLSRPLVAAFAALALAGVGTAAQARDNVYWSLGINAAPGVAVGVGNYAPAYIAPQPVYVAPQPVYMAPPPVYVSRPAVIVAPAPLWYYGYGHRGHHRGWEHRHGRHWR